MIKELFGDFFQNKWRFETVLKAAAALIILIEAAILAFANLSYMQQVYDGGMNEYISATTTMWLYGSPFTGAAASNGSLFLDSPAPLAALLVNITGSAPFAYGISNIIVAMLLAVAMLWLTRKLTGSTLTRLLVLAIVLCPFICGDFQANTGTGYFAGMLFGEACYSIRALTAVLTLGCYTDIAYGRRNIPMLAVTGVLLAVSGISSGVFMIVYMLLPLLVWQITAASVRKSRAELFSPAMQYIVAAALLTAAGAIAGSLALGAKNVSGFTVFSLSELNAAFTRLIYGYFMLTGALSPFETVPAVSAAGLSFLPGLAILLVGFVAFIWTIVRFAKAPEEKTGLYPIIAVLILANLALLHLSAPQNAAGFCAEGNIEHIFLLAAVLTAVFTENLKNPCWKGLLTAGILAVVLLSAGLSLYRMLLVF